MATGAKVTGAVTRWWWVRHAPVPNPERRCYGQSDKDCDVSNEALFKHQAALLPKGAVWYSSNLLRARKTAEELARADLGCVTTAVTGSAPSTVWIARSSLTMRGPAVPSPITAASPSPSPRSSWC